jgi:hypothetical protein
MWKGGMVADNSTALGMCVCLSNSYMYAESFNGFAFVHLFSGWSGSLSYISAFLFLRYVFIYIVLPRQKFSTTS